jgi:tetratricopeptide (TPR) repeat protein
MSDSRARWIVGLTALVFAVSLTGSAFAEWNKGLEAYNKRDYATAAKEFEDVTKTNPDYAGGYYMLGLSQRAQGNLSPALASLREAVKLDPENVSYKVGLGQALLQAKQYQDAYSTLKGLDINSMDAKHRSSYALLFAQAATKTNRPGEAVQVLTAQTRADSSNARLYQALGVAQNDLGDDAQAFAAFKRAYELNPSDAAVGRNAVKAGIATARRSGSASQKSQSYTQAAQIAERVAGSSPTFEHKLLAGEAWLGAKQYQKALGWFDQAKADQPQNALVFYYSAQSKTSLNQLDGAVSDLQAALKVGPPSKLRGQIYNQMGYVYDKKKDYGRAASAYSEAGNSSKRAEMEQKAEAQQQNLQADREKAEFEQKLRALELQIQELEAIGEMEEAGELRKQLEELKKHL